MRQEIKLRLDTKILDEAREVIKQSGSKSIEIDDVIEKWCLERIESEIKTLFIAVNEICNGGRFELENEKWRFYNAGRRWMVINEDLISCLNKILSETNDKFCIDLLDENISKDSKKIILDWLEDDE